MIYDRVTYNTARAPRDASDEELRRADVDVRAGLKHLRQCLSHLATEPECS